MDVKGVLLCYQIKSVTEGLLLSVSVVEIIIWLPACVDWNMQCISDKEVSQQTVSTLLKPSVNLKKKKKKT